MALTKDTTLEVNGFYYIELNCIINIEEIYCRHAAFYISMQTYIKSRVIL